MNDQELKDLWRGQKVEEVTSVDARAQIEAVRTKMSKFHHGLNRAYFMELAARAVIVIIFGVYFFTIEFPVTRIGALIVVAGELFVSWKLIRQRRRAEPDAGVPVAAWLKQEREWLQEWVHDVKPFRTALWQDLLPLWPGINVFIWGFPHVDLAGKIAFTAFYTLILAVGPLLNKYGRPKKALPLENELEALLETQNSSHKPALQAPLKKPERSTAWIVVSLVIALVAVIAGAWNSFRNPETESPLRAPAFDNVSAFTDADFEKVDAWLQELVALAQYPSLSVAVVRDRKIVYQRAFGFEDIEAQRRAAPETSYHVASVTKVFTASLAVLLHARGVVDLDQPVVKYLPKGVSISTKPEIGATITLRQLASHTSGLPRGIPGRVQSVEGRYELEPKRLYEHLDEVDLEFDPGTGELYSNLGFGLLGHALEVAAAKPFDRLLQELLCEPLKLEGTSIHVDQLRVATGYSSSVPRREREHFYRERLAPSGGLIASAPDLAKFLAAQMEPGFFSSETLAQLHTPSRLVDGSNARTALGWSIGSHHTLGPIVQKNGGRNNCSAWIGFSPRCSRAVPAHRFKG